MKVAPLWESPYRARDRGARHRPGVTGQWLSRERSLIGGVLLLTAVTYIRCLGNGFVSDDELLVGSNAMISRWSFLWKSLVRDEYWFSAHPGVSHARYRPILLAWYWLNYHLLGFNPAPWHAAAVAVHLLAVYLLFKVAVRLTNGRRTSILAALIFGLTPIHAQSVVWEAGVGVVLSSAAQLAALYLLMTRAGRERRNWTLALLLYATAPLNHDSALAFPGLVAAYFFFLGDDPAADPLRATNALWSRARKAITYGLPFAVEVALYFCARLAFLGFLLTGGDKPVNHLTSAQALLMVPRAMLDYLILLAIPWRAGPDHSIFVVNRPLAAGFWTPLGALVAIGLAFVLGVRRSPRRRVYWFCGAWVLMALVPLMDLRALYQFVQDTYLYLPSAGFSIMLAGWTVAIADRSRASLRAIVWGAAATLVASYAVVLWHVQYFWHDDITLFAGYVEKFPRSATWRMFLANRLLSAGDRADAERQIEIAKRLEPDHTGTLCPAIDYPQVALARLFAQNGNPARAEEELEEALRIDPTDGAGLYQLGLLHAKLGRTRKAAEEIERALRLMKDPPPMAYVSLAEIYDALGEGEKSEAVLKRTESLKGGQEAAALTRARLAVRHGDRAAAEKILRDTAARFSSDERVWTMLGLFMDDAGRESEALAAYERALELSPDDARLHFFAARALHALGRDHEAREECREALTIDPAYAPTRALMAQLGSPG